MNKKERQSTIKKLVRDKKIKTQDEIMLALKKRGVKATQATISRDISDLNLDKSKNGFYVLAEDVHLAKMMRDFVNEIVMANNLVLVKCSAGAAPGFAAALDKIKWKEVLGTIAGDDTVLMITSDKMSAKSVQEKLKMFNRLN